MMRLPKLTPRQILIVLHDLVATAAALLLTFFVRFEGAALDARLAELKYLPVFLAYAAAIYLIFGLHRNKWRFTSVPDLYDIFRTSTVLAVSLLALDYVLVAPNVYGTFFFGKITILLYWFLQMFFLGGTRIAYRYFHYARTLQRAKIADATPTLILGRAADAEILLRAIESGAVKKIWPVGVLSPSSADRGQSIRGVPVLGDIDDLERVVADFAGRNTIVTRVVLTPSALSPEARPEALLIRARKLGLTMSQLPALDAGGQAMQLAPVAVEDLLLRPSVKIDYRRLETLRQRQSDCRDRRRRLDRLGNLRAHGRLRRRAPPGAGELGAGAARRRGIAQGGAGEDGNHRPHRRRPRPRPHHEPDRAIQARHGVPRRGAQARAAVGNRLGRRHQDQRVRLDQRRRCRGRGRRRRHGDDLDRQGDRAGLRARRHQALRRNVLRGARQRARAAGAPARRA